MSVSWRRAGFVGWNPAYFISLKQKMAENPAAKAPEAVKEEQQKLLIASLAASRFGDDADVTLVCGETEFPAHKLVLGLTSPYFYTMFRSGLEESNSGKVVFKDITPQTLEFILDFVYLGEVGNIKSQEQAIDVVKASHMMQLHSLTEYCCDTLLAMVTMVNFQELWYVAELYGHERLLAKVFMFVLQNISQIIEAPIFLQLSAQQLERLLNFSKTNGYFVDAALHVILNWLKHDLSTRTVEAVQLLNCVDANLVSKHYVKWLVESERNKCLPGEILNRLKDIALAKLVTDEKGSASSGPSGVGVERNMNINCCNGVKLAFIANDTPSSSYFFQQFDLHSREWLPAKKLPCTTDFEIDAVCQYNKHTVCMVGRSPDSMYMLYNVRFNTLRYVTCTNNVSIPGSAVCHFEDCLFLFGSDNKINKNVYCLPSGRTKWINSRQLKWSDPLNVMFVKTKYYLYLCWLEKDTDQQKIMQTFGFDSVAGCWWTEIEIPVSIRRLKPYFCCHNDYLIGLCDSGGEVIQFTRYFTEWSSELFAKPSLLYTGITFLSTFGQHLNMCLLFSRTTSKLAIPSIYWEPKSGKCIELSPSKGNCEISNCVVLLKLFVEMV